MRELEYKDVSYFKVFRIWWSWIWRACLFSLIANAVCGFVCSLAATILKIDPTASLIASIVLSIIVGVCVATWQFKKMFYRSFKTFEVRILAV